MKNKYYASEQLGIVLECEPLDNEGSYNVKGVDGKSEKKMKITAEMLPALFETKDEALIHLYKKTVNELLEQKEKYVQKLINIDTALTNVHNKHSALKSKYPEEFI